LNFLNHNRLFCAWATHELSKHIRFRIFHVFVAVAVAFVEGALECAGVFFFEYAESEVLSQY
jgi:hypothetical protein